MQKVRSETEGRRSVQSLLVDWSHGDSSALDEVLEAYSAWILCLAKKEMGRRLQSRECPEDIAQSVMLRLLRDRKPYHFPCETAWLSFLRRVVKNEICDRSQYYRAQVRTWNREVPLDASTAEQEISEELSPEEFAIHNEEVELVEGVLASASETTRRLARAHRSGAGGYESIGKWLGISDAAARMRCQRAFLDLRRRVRAAVALRQARPVCESESFRRRSKTKRPAASNPHRVSRRA